MVKAIHLFKEEKSMTRKGLFITFEGGEGSGKSTAIQGVADYFQSQGQEVLVTREPGGVEVAEKIRGLLVNEVMDTLTEAMLFAAARNEIMRNLIIPSLQEGKVVLCDRFIDSSFVYQGIVKGLGIQRVKEINDMVLGTVQPDITFYLDIHPEIGLARIFENNRETNKFDLEGVTFHHRIRQGYQLLTQLYPERIRVVNAEQSKEDVVQDCIRTLHQFL